ncbi:DedA family protein [Waterburya agarophytonicola K14]|uniref:DedA family protein n=1 Tax=Waterburya agarophytonicola KI4 TaxID=2874699 RepID=A0A964BPR1_9CYAN|nr:DedA family protein [Waterburya agarophytonicola]MCC0176087.1 DedA family protein [Waterburya agarophytonicola KI4]
MSLEFFSLDTLQEIARLYGYWTVFGGIALENMGIPLPGETIVIVGGFLAGSGELNYWLVLGSAIAGAVLGDNFGYWVGRVGGWQLLVKVGSIFRIQEQQLEQAKDRYSQNAAQAVFWGRFVTILRIFAGPLAGITKMPYKQFLLYNFGGAAVWSTTIVSLAYFLGKVVTLEEIVGWVTRFGIVALLIIIVGFVAWEYRQKKLFSKE